MPRRTPMKKARDVLNALRETLDHPEELGVSKETGIIGDDILTRLNIRVHPLEIDPLGHVSMTFDDPPFLFEILPESELRRHPPRQKLRPFGEYLEPSERPEAERPGGHLDFAWSSEARGIEISEYITYFAFKPSRENLPKSCGNLGEYRNLGAISHPDPFLWGGGGLDGEGNWFLKNLYYPGDQKKG
ncbi:hypothetical protein DTO207G8_5012 [Paecilomyces variotii]|nr:hypothetical protein DTO207G8_5012 [Paecilomyces variotii]